MLTPEQELIAKLKSLGDIVDLGIKQLDIVKAHPLYDSRIWNGLIDELTFMPAMIKGRIEAYEDKFNNKGGE